MNSGRIPTTPPQRNGWEVLNVVHSVNGQYLVVAKRGAQVLRIDRMDDGQVETFDAQSRWEAQ